MIGQFTGAVVRLARFFIGRYHTSGYSSTLFLSGPPVYAHAQNAGVERICACV